MEGSELTYIEHLSFIAEQTGDYSEIDKKPIPGIVSHIWDWFLELNSARGEGGISYSEIKAWMELTGKRLTPFELTLIKKLDILFLTRNSDNG